MHWNLLPRKEEELREEEEGSPWISVNRHGRRQHRKEARPVSRRDYGKIRMEFRNRVPGFVDAKGDPMRFQDLFEHMIVFGGSGTGKTYSVLQPMWEEWFRASHLPDGDERERLKFGALVIEAKGDFRDKTWALAKRYGRMDDCIFFGPTHLNHVYDPFGDETESPMQLSSKLLELMKAMSGGKGTEDPFWDNAARKLFLNIFLLYRAVRDRWRSAASEEDRAAYEAPAMTFSLLNLILMDRGQPRNAADVQAADQRRDELAADYLARSRELADLYLQVELHLGVLEDRRRDLRMEAIKKGALGPPEAGLAASRLAELCGPVDPDPVEGEVLGGAVGRVRCLTRDLQSLDDDEERAQRSNDLANLVFDISEAFRERYRLVVDIQRLPELANQQTTLAGVASLLAKAIERGEAALEARENLLRHKPVEPAYGVLKRLIVQYEKLLGEKGIEPKRDAVWAYFHEEYLNVVNDKTSGSVAMVASNLVTPLSHPPFSQILSSNATYSFNQVIDEGKIVYLDMPAAIYKKSAEVASLVMKMDFFRAALMRPRLNVRGEDGRLKPQRVNQERPLVYFCDEFASVVSTGEDTGEAGFMDKVREFKCACLLGVQSLPMLYRKMQEAEVDAILTNTAIKVFMNNTDLKTNEYASKLLGTEIKVSSNLGKSAAESLFAENTPIGARPFSTSFSRDAKFRAGDFAKLERGQAIIRLNPRFRQNQVQKVHFKGRAIVDPDGGAVPVEEVLEQS